MPTGVYVRTEGHRRNIGKANKGQIPWNKGKTGVYSKEVIIKMSETRRGENNSHWRGGRWKNEDGYIFVFSPNHPRASRGYVFEHRLVVEAQIGRYLESENKVHHLGAKDDNKPQMLMAFISTSVHKRFEKCGKVKPEEIIFDGRELVKI